MTIQPTRYSDILSAEKSLISEYAEECSIPEIGEPNPQESLYAQMEAAQLMRCFGVFDGEKLVGFATILFYIVPHYGKKIASVESLFVLKSHRDGGIGNDLMSTIENEAKENGCAVILYSAPTSSQLEKVLSLRKGCRRTNSVFTRKLQ